MPAILEGLIYHIRECVRESIGAKEMKDIHPTKHSAQHARSASTGWPSALALFRTEFRMRRRISSSVTIRDPKATEPKDLKARPRECSVGRLGCRLQFPQFRKREKARTYHSTIICILRTKVIPATKRPSGKSDESHITNGL
jgi:hypothetical protein